MKSMPLIALLAGTLTGCMADPAPTIEVRWQLLDGAAPAQACEHADGRVWIRFVAADGADLRPREFVCADGATLLDLDPTDVREVCIAAGQRRNYYETCDNGNPHPFGCTPGPRSYTVTISEEACGELPADPAGALFDVTLHLERERRGPL